MGADLVVTIGADSREFQNGLAIAKREANNIPGAGGSGGMGAVGTSFLGLAGKVVDGFKAINNAVKGFLDESMEIRSMSNSTGLSSSQIYEFKFVAEQMGMGIQNFTHAFSEFNRKMGEARIKGSEMNNLLNKLGISQEEVSSGSFTATKGFYELVKAYEAGTDAQTLAYYGNVMFGSSFEQMLPAIKQGSISLKGYAKSITTVSDDSTRALARASDAWNGFITNIWNSIREGTGKIISFTAGNIDKGLIGLHYFASNVIQTTMTDKKILGGPSQLGFMDSDFDKVKDFAKRIAGEISNNPSFNKEERDAYIREAASYYSDKEQREKFMKYMDDFMKTGGVKLTPLGLHSAQGASTMQQMGGGDIVSAIAFTPLERIADATEETARNTAPSAQTTIEKSETKTVLGS